MIQKIKRSSLTGFLRYWGILCFCVGGTLQGQNIVSPISFVPDNSVQVHNLALNRAAYHSSIEEAVYKMTGRAAKPLHLDRGVLETGKAADINIFHLENLLKICLTDHRIQNI